MMSASRDEVQRIPVLEIVEDPTVSTKQLQLMSSPSAYVSPSGGDWCTLRMSWISRGTMHRRDTCAKLHAEDCDSDIDDDDNNSNVFARWRFQPLLRLRDVSHLIVVLVVLSAFCFATGLGEDREPIRVRFVGAKLDKITTLSDGTIWAAGDGQVFVYDRSAGNWVSTATISPPGTPAVLVGRAQTTESVSEEVGVVCFAANRGLCSILIHNKDTGTTRIGRLDGQNYRNHGSNFSLITPLEHHSKGSPVLFAVNRNADTSNESPLSLLQLKRSDINDESTINKSSYGFTGYMGQDNHYSMIFATEIRFTVKYLHAFHYNGFAYIVTVQPMVTDNFKRSLTEPIFETRLARFCLDDRTLKSYTEIPISCKTNSNRYDVAVHARHIVRGSNYTLLVTMGQVEGRESQPDTTRASALCAFSVDDLVMKFNDATANCRAGVDANYARQSSLYQHTDTRGPLSCQMASETSECHPVDNAYIVGMKTVEGTVVFASQRKNPPDVTYIYKRTRTEGVSVGTLTTFEVERPDAPIASEPIYVWIADHKGQLHRVLITSKFAVHLVTVDTALLHDSAVAVRDTGNDEGFGGNLGPITESASSSGRIHFLKQDRVIEIDTDDTCAFYLNCGDCLNPRRATDDIVGCKWENGRCTPGKGDYCVPFVSIDESGPFQGPQQGGNLLTLKGFDFGNPPADIRQRSIRVGSNTCVVKEWGYLTITCEVPKQTGSSEGKVMVSLLTSDLKLDERLKDYQISSNGWQDVTSYTYYPVKFYGAFPSFGPEMGGTKLTLTGENIGYDDKRIQYALVGNNTSTKIKICETFAVVNRTHLTCNTARFPPGAKDRDLHLSLMIGTVRYFSNAATNAAAEFFQYTKNPSNIEVDGSSRLHYFFAGGRGYDIIFKGDNLHASVEPHILVKVYGDKVISETCITGKKATMTCKAPSLFGHDIQLSNRPIHASMELQFDGFLYRKILTQLTYYPNATINSKHIEKAVAGPAGETRVTIPGMYLSPLEKKDIVVQIAERPCEVNRISDTAVVCTAQLERGKHPVEVRINNSYLLAGTYEGEVNVVGHSAGMDWSVILAIVITILVIIVAGALLAFYYIRLRAKVEKDEPCVVFKPENDGYLNPDSERLLTTIPPDPEIIQQLSDWGLLMDFSCIQVGALIGKGQFGCVYRGVLKRDKMSDEEAVAVKTLQQQGYTTNDANVFLKEALRMKDFNHPNVLCLIGVSFDNNNSSDPMIIVPYMAKGDLLLYIRNQNERPTVKDLITFGANIAQGMSYLTSQKFIHRDLAARNCMVGDDMIVRVADFGLSRDVYETSYYSSDNAKTKLPVKWMALESLIGGHYSHKSDVWSFGVVLWELMTRGCQPYPNVDNWEVHLWLKEGRRMLQPAYCPDALYRIMLQCWHEDPQQRPTFSQLVKDVPNVIHTIEMSTRNCVPQYIMRNDDSDVQDCAA